jgi:hypothetical protein
MKSFIKKLCTQPKRIRSKIRYILYLQALENLRKRIVYHYSKLSPLEINAEQLEVLEFLKKNPICNFPNDFYHKYKLKDITVFRDDQKGLCYVFLDGKRMYFKRSWSEKKIQITFNFLLIEQDENSPHRYLTNEFFVEHNQVVFDIGAAEGNFSLSIIEKARKIYLFETDPEWIEALEATFEPWKEKVEIINKHLSSINDGKNMSLDSFMEDIKEVDFIKIDVDGSEAELLKGCEKLLKDKQPLKIALCTYHKQFDEEIFSRLLKNNDFEITLSKGYMIFISGELNDLKPPYLRRGLIRAKK